MKKIQFCCGQNRLAGWENHDEDIDITKYLPFPPESADFIFIEHGIEHTDQMKAFRFFKGCFDILKKGGVMRVTFPDVFKILKDAKCQESYSLRWGYVYNPDKKINALMHTIFNFGHKSFWSAATIQAAMETIGFKAYQVQAGRSEYEELQNVEQHWRSPQAQLKCTEAEAKQIENAHTGNVEGVKV